MPLLNFIINEKKIDQTIASLGEKKEKIDQIVNQVVSGIIREKFPRQDYDGILKVHKKEIEHIKNDLISEYAKEIGQRINHLSLLKKEIYKHS